MKTSKYLMEDKDEALRLVLKTDIAVLKRQAEWAGIKPGMRIADIGCGAGKTTYHLCSLTQPGGQAVGLDMSKDRINFAKKNYGSNEIEYVCEDVYKPLNKLGQFDFIWVRFFLEYHRAKSFEIIKNLTELLKPGGVLCLIDLDCNCLRHFGIPPRLDRAITGIMKTLETGFDFDPYIGIKLYSYLYDLKYKNINVAMEPHHLIFGELNEKDDFNWTRKVLVGAKRAGYEFNEYTGGYDEFVKEYQIFFSDPRRFTYTPLILCRGTKP